jgi:hypothetical protein
MNIMKFCVAVSAALLLTGCVYTTYTKDAAGNTVKSEQIIIPPAPRLYAYPYYSYPYVTKRYKVYRYYEYPKRRDIHVPYKPFKKGPSPYYERYYSPRKHID